jgi:hypothetical protein
MASEATNSRPGVGASVGPSPFSRPPQPKPISMYDRPVTTPTVTRPNGADVSHAAATATTTAGPVDEARKALESQRRNGAQWFYWVAALSLINCVVALTGAQWRFILGLGVTQVVQELSESSASSNVIAGLVSLAVIGLFAFLGYQAVKGHGWAFITGMVLYALDGVIFLLVQDWAGVGFHAFALVMIGRGFVAARQL